MATRFKSPVYAELSAYISVKAGAPPVRVRAHRGYFDIEDKELKAFRKFAADRPHYRIEEVGEAPVEVATRPTELHGKVRQPSGVTDAERHPELAIPTTDELVEAPEPTDDEPTDDDLIEAADEDADELDGDDES